jgi:hypothetical protein
MGLAAERWEAGPPKEAKEASAAAGVARCVVARAPVAAERTVGTAGKRVAVDIAVVAAAAVTEASAAAWEALVPGKAAAAGVAPADSAKVASAAAASTEASAAAEASAVAGASGAFAAAEAVAASEALEVASEAVQPAAGAAAVAAARLAAEAPEVEAVAEDIAAVVPSGGHFEVAAWVEAGEQAAGKPAEDFPGRVAYSRRRILAGSLPRNLANPLRLRFR